MWRRRPDHYTLPAHQAQVGQKVVKGVTRPPLVTEPGQTPPPTYGVMTDPQYEQQERLIVSLLDQIAGHVRENAGLWDQLKKDAERIDEEDRRVAELEAEYAAARTRVFELELTVKALGTQLAGARRGPLDFPAPSQPHRVSDDLLATGWGARSSADAGGET